MTSLHRCPNPLDDMRSSIPVDNEGKTNSHSQVWRFDVKTFAFVDPHTSHHSIEEVSLPNACNSNTRVCASHNMAACDLLFRYISIVWWKSAPMTPPAHRDALSSVSESVIFLMRDRIYTVLMCHCWPVSHSIWGWETKTRGRLWVWPGPAGVFRATAAGKRHWTGRDTKCQT